VIPKKEIFAKLDPILTVSRNDSMVAAGAEQQYYDIGRSALQLITMAGELCDKPHYPKILDYACGHGRVLRWIKAQYPYAEITACDIDEDAVEYCASTFEVKGAVADNSFANGTFENQFDLIWCGSLLTHLDSKHWWAALERMIAWTAECGVLIFSVQGRFLASEMLSGRAAYASNVDVERLLENYRKSGYAFEPYFENPHNEYGMTLTSPGFLGKAIERYNDVILRSYMEQAWGVQDVVILYKSKNFFCLQGPAGNSG
jgi:SAM-dependent methyltransferase